MTPTSAHGAQALSPLANPESRGLLLHSAVAVTEAGLPLSIAQQEVWIRDDEDPPSRPARYRTPIEGKESAKWLRSTRIIDGYARRWLIERFYDVLKSDTRLEARQRKSAAGWQRLTVLSSLVAWQVLWLSELGWVQPGVSAAMVVPAPVWQAVGALVTGAIPVEPPDLATLVAQIGQLGGHLGRRGDGPPGVKTLWLGLRRVRDVLGIWHLVASDTDHRQCV